MITSRTPYRISFFGGGTDYPTWFHEHGGQVLGATIDKYCYIHCRYFPPFFDYRYRIVYSKTEICSQLEEIKHPSVRETLRYLEILEGVEVLHFGDLPARTGIGSSSAFTVGLLNVLNALQGKIVSKEQLASSAIHIEQNLIKEQVGCQDQTLTAFGGFNHIQFKENGKRVIIPIRLTAHRLEGLQSHLMLFFTGIARTASEIAGVVVEGFKNHGKNLQRMNDFVQEAISIVTSNQDWADFGRLLHDNWMLKRTLANGVTNSTIDSIYQKSLDAGAVGGKLLGAGGGGFLLLVVPPEKRTLVRTALKQLLHVPFRLEYQGSSIVIYEPTQLEQAA